MRERGDRALGFDFCFCLCACCSFFFEGCEEFDCHVGVGDHVFDGGWCGIHAVFADRRQDFAGDPALERLSFRLAGHEDDLVESSFCDDVCLLSAP